MLLRNGTYFQASPCSFMAAASIHVESRPSWSNSGNIGNISRSEDAASNGADRSAIPSGYVHPYCWSMPIKPGGMATYNTIFGEGTISSSNLAGGLNAEATLAGSGDITNAGIVWIIVAAAALVGTGTINADINAVGELVSALTGSGDITDADLVSVINATASLTGSGDITDANLNAISSVVAALTGSGGITDANLAGLIQAVADLTGSGDITDANLNALGTLVGALTGSGDITNANLNAIANIISALTGSGTIDATLSANGSLSADITVTGDLLSTANVGAAVWQEVLESIPGGTPYNARQIMQALYAVLCGKVTGGPGGPEFLSPSDETTVRVAMTADSSGNRTVITLTLE